MSISPPRPPAPVLRHHRLAVLRANGISAEWIAERSSHVTSRWLEGTLQSSTPQHSLWDQLAQEMADMEARGRGESTAYREGVHRIADRFVRAIESEFGTERSRAEPREPASTTGIVGAINDVFAFHDAMDVPCLDAPQWPGNARAQLRHELIREEFEELGAALLVDERGPNYNDLAPRPQLCAIADALADLIYVCIGTALEFGIPLERVWREVQRANMAKVGGPIRADGKRLKPDGWQPPNIDKAVFGPRYNPHDLEVTLHVDGHAMPGIGDMRIEATIGEVDP